MNSYSFFEFKLTAYIVDAHPHLITEKNFIHERAQLALDTFAQGRKHGMDLVSSMELADEVMYKGLKFSLYNQIMDLLEVKLKQIREAYQQNADKYMMDIFYDLKKYAEEKYNLNDDFFSSPEYSEFEREMNNLIRLKLKSDGIQ